jgi:IS30 family transposase
MKRQFKTPKRQRNECKARKLDREKVLDLHRKGLSSVAIAQHQGVAPSTVWRFLERTKPQQQALERFKTNRANELANVHGKAIEVQSLVLDRMKKDLENNVVVDALTPTAKTQYLNAAAMAGGVSFDKERLERNLSTSNQSIHSTMLDATVKNMYKPKSFAREKSKAKKKDVPDSTAP